MGNFISLPDYNIYVRTGDLRGSGTDANVYVVLHSESGEKSEVIRLANLWRNNFERGRTDIFAVRNLPNFGPIAKLEIWRDALFGDEWYVDYVEVEDGTQENRYPFPIQRWVTVQHLIIYKYDSVLPQFAPNPEERKTELDEKRSVYKSVTQVEGLPPFVTTVPRNEAFTVTYRYEIDKTKFQLSITALVKMFKGLVSSKEWKSFDDVNSLYGGFLEEPMHVDSWKEEWYFAEQRLRGSNPVQIRLCTEIPDNLGVTDDMMQPLLEGLTISDAIAEKRLFIVNYTILKDVPTTSKNVTLCAPIALFFLNKDKDLTTVAIQLFQDKAEDNPVFLPTDPPNTWLLAKMYFNTADASVHEANTHLLCTHLAMECFAMSTHRHLSPSHPMYRLMIPHFQYMLPMNHKGYPTLMDPGGWFDKIMTMGRVGAEELMRRQWKEWRIDLKGDIVNELKSRGVDDPEVLPNYPYRDDALLTYKAIETYVGKVVNGNYDTADKLREDFELSEWAKALNADPPTGFGVKGMPNEGKFNDNAELIRVITSVIANCSIGHAAANFTQYDEYANPLKHSANLIGTPPKTKVALTEQDVLKHLPDKRKVTEGMMMMKILSANATLSLGYFDQLYQSDAIGKQAVEEFRRDLLDIGKTIDERNVQRKASYPYLHPRQLPNAISI